MRGDLPEGSGRRAVGESKVGVASGVGGQLRAEGDSEGLSWPTGVPRLCVVIQARQERY